MIEVTHGPCTVDNNIMLSTNALQNAAQGTAFVHNILGGNMNFYGAKDRQMPYHMSHSTWVLGVAPIFTGDDRILNNIILCKEPNAAKYTPMQLRYSANSSPDEYYEKIKEGKFSHGNPPALPVWMEDNAYAKEVEHLELEKGAVTAEGLSASIERCDNEWFLNLNVPEVLVNADCKPVTTERLGAPVYSEAPYENPDETPLDLVSDLVQNKRDDKVIPGPFASLIKGKQRIKIWDR